MGTITIKEYGASGGGKDHSSPILNLYTLLRRTTNASTSTTQTSLELLKGTSFVRILGVEDHRVTQKEKLADNSTDATDSLYEDAAAGVNLEAGVKAGGSTLYYRADA